MGLLSLNIPLITPFPKYEDEVLVVDICDFNGNVLLKDISITIKDTDNLNLKNLIFDIDDKDIEKIQLNQESYFVGITFNITRGKNNVFLHNDSRLKEILDKFDKGDYPNIV